ncbi:TIGR03915 family putative DNA repair protein [Ramlibacter sp.]|uniref:TIGR03915 family putative DNA repair protein n=1 Tax=Ramlibacter sp. TaxID=1917967 RepID=UPI002C4194EB|nr:TIGR03915 family putative DNA repair protein [Ramlibacter sp.]HWI83513.1 TIGR03915 family putative DNA repair protein [Ramlibacter sp.]
MQARLASETDLAGFREEARLLLRRQVPPEAVHWETAQAQNSDQFADPAGERPRDMPKAASAIVPASFLRLCEVVVLHHDPDRFALLYRLLWRLVHEPGLRNDPVDPDMLHAHQMAQSVRRDLHKMKAFVRFRAIPLEQAPPLHLAWYEPAHHLLEAAAPWFAKRGPPGRWAIFTPERSVESDGQRLHYGPGVPRSRVPPAEASDAAWLDCYHGVFDRQPTPGEPQTP